MKQTSVFILAIFYLYFSVGATLHQHYCMGELVGTSLFDFKDEECAKCGMEKHGESTRDCCKDVSITIKSDGSHTLSQAVYDFNSYPVLICAAHLPPVNFEIPKNLDQASYHSHSPPLSKHSLFLQFGNFRI